MATCLLGDVLSRAWGRQVGRLQPTAQADLVVLKAKRGADAFSSIVASTEDAVDLVVIDGLPRYGTPELTAKALPAAAGVMATAFGPQQPGTTTVQVAGTDQSWPAMPGGAGFTIAFRRAIRSAAGDGIPIEDLGIPGLPYEMGNLLDGNKDLLAFCTRLLQGGR